MRKRVRAIIIEEDRVLLMHRIKGEKEYWVFPGGGVEEHDADLAAALRRECEEELGVQVEVGEFCMNTYFEMEGETHEQHIYFCKILSGEVGTGAGPEFQPDGGYEGSFEIEWVTFTELKEKKVYPPELKNKLMDNL